jgi:hypothetical protein
MKINSLYRNAYERISRMFRWLFFVVSDILEMLFFTIDNLDSSLIERLINRLSCFNVKI